MTNNALPDKPSELLRMGLEDFAKIEADPRYVPDLDAWHEPYDDGRCHACLAGGTMARRLGVLPEEYKTPFDFDDETCHRLRALDCLRDGDTYRAGEVLGNSALYNFPEREIPKYAAARAAWRAALEQFANDLEVAGL